MDKILLIDKPKGITSFDVIRRLRKQYKGYKMGHAGTLDPLASGLMVIGIGDGTKSLKEIIGADKTYEAEIILGERRSTGDMEGEILEEIAVNDFDEEKIKKVLKDMIGVIRLPVSKYSAVKQGGESLYKKVRRGEKVIIPLRDMEIKFVNLEKIEQKINRVHVFVTFEVGSGTYIRSLAEELGNRLELPATLGNLRRIRVGRFNIEDVTIKEWEKL